MGGILSGVLLEHFWWGSIFLINVFVVVMALVVGFFLIWLRQDPHAARPARRVPLDRRAGHARRRRHRAPDHGWASTQTILTLAVAIVVIAAFVWWEFHAKEPMLDLRFFKNPRFTVADYRDHTCVLRDAGFVLPLHPVPPVRARVRPAERRGACTLPWALVYMLAATRSAKLVERLGQRLVVSSGLVLAGVGLAILAARQPYQ